MTVCPLLACTLLMFCTCMSFSLFFLDDLSLPSWGDTCITDTLSLCFWTSSSESDPLPTSIHCSSMTTLFLSVCLCFVCVCVCGIWDVYVSVWASIFTDIFLTSTAKVQHQQLLQTHWHVVERDANQEVDSICARMFSSFPVPHFPTAPFSF